MGNDSDSQYRFYADLAESLADKALNGSCVEESARLVLAQASNTYATLALAEATRALMNE